MAYRFHPSRESPFVMGVVNFLFPVLLPLRERVVRVTIDPEEWRWLVELRDHRALLLPNHPSETEPVIMAWLARRLGERFNYVATHELFAGPKGWLVRRVGAFSIRRGRPDRASLPGTHEVGGCQRVLAEQDRKLVIFPEGETHQRNDMIIPLNQGAIQIGFWSLERLAELGKPISLPVLPVIIKYRYVGNPRPALRRGIGRLELRLGLPRKTSYPLAERVRRAGLVVLAGVEREYGLSTVSRDDRDTAVDERIAALYQLISGRVAHVLHVPLPVTPSVPVGMRALFNATFDYLEGLAAGKTFYERRLHARRVTAARACLNDLWRVQNFMVMSENGLAPRTVEQLGEALWRLEREVYGKPRTRPRREVLVRLGPPIELADQLQDYRTDRKATLARCTAEVESCLRTLLRSVDHLGTPV